MSDLCGYIRRCSDLICKYQDKKFEKRRHQFFANLQDFVLNQLGTEAEDKVRREVELIAKIEHGYQGIIGLLDRCVISQHPATVRVSGCISRACFDYQEVIRRYNRLLTETKELNPMSGLYLEDDDGNKVSIDAIVEGLSGAVALTLIMEAYKNNWFVNDIVILPDLAQVDDKIRYQSGSTQALALFWRQWQRVEKRRRFLGGNFSVYSGDKLPAGLPEPIAAMIAYTPHEEDELFKRDVYDFLANTRLKDRLIQTFIEMEIETGLSGQGVGIIGGAKLPPAQLVSLEEVHVGVSLSELLGYSIAHDHERPGGLRLIEWVRGYVVLKEIAKMRTENISESGDIYAIVLTEKELIETLHACGLEGEIARLFVARTCLHRSSRDMFDCPLVRVSTSNYLLFGPAIINLNVSMAVLSNLSNRSENIGHKGKAFEHSIQKFFQKLGMEVYAFRANRNGEEFEYDAIVPWDGYLFLFECKNRSLSGNDPAQIYYFDLDVASQAKQVRRLADALEKYPDIIKKHLGSKYVGMTIIPCVLHSLPYSRTDDLDGVYFTDASALTRFFEQPYFRIKVPHHIGSATLLHRTAVKKIWKGDTPTVQDFLGQLRKPFQLELSMKHLDISTMQFFISETEIAMTKELIRTDMTARSVCEAVGVDADSVLQEISSVAENSKTMRSTLEKSDARSTD
ncbi:MAG: hypothetical protein HQM03_10815 [Magnetococcales bacterium]|nr:hypothetical protein [Magnetococcales bacterium]